MIRDPLHGKGARPKTDSSFLIPGRGMQSVYRIDRMRRESEGPKRSIGHQGKSHFPLSPLIKAMQRKIHG